jgi:HK97 family phage major capsid protein
MPFPALLEVEGKLKAKQDELGKIFEEAGEDLDFKKVKSVPSGVPSGDTKAIADWVVAVNNECTELGKERERLLPLEAAAKAANDRRRAQEGLPPADEDGDGAKSGPKRGGDGAALSMGEMFVKSAAFKSRLRGAAGPESHLDIDMGAELKTTMSTTAGWAPETTRSGKLVEFAYRPVQVLDILPQGTIDQVAYTWMEETTFTNAAVETAEAGLYAESALALTQRSQAVQKVATWLPITDEQLEDVNGIRAYVDGRLSLFLKLRLDGQVINGNGTPPNLRGIAQTAGILTQPKGADTGPDAIYKAMTQIRVTGRANPGAIAMHPTDWQNIRLMRTADGIYIWGSPTEAGPERVWGLPVAITDVLTAGTALVGDFATHCMLFYKRGIDVQITNAHASFFINGLQAVRADVRAVMVVFRPAAFGTVTGL